MAKLTLYNTLTDREEVFEPTEPPAVKMYVCGPTVYDHSHIGHARAYVSYDVVYRYLKHLGYRVLYARNITDIDDKIIQRANREGVDFRTVAETYERSYHEDMDALGLLRPDVEPRATETIAEILAMISTLIERGRAYESRGDVYFAVRAMPDYGKLSKRNLDDLKAGARVEPGEQKRDPLDFALWKASKPGEPSWDSPFGPGRPAWHIECSAMNRKIHGDTIDLHAGGRDLIFPHHENEIAQSEGSTGKPFAKYWIHNGFLNLASEKMSKSLGNILTIKDVLAKFHPEAMKLYLLSTHYRHPMDFSDQGLEESAKALSRLYRVLYALPASPETAVDEAYRIRFEEAMGQDFNTAKALGVFFEIAREANRSMLKSETMPRATTLSATLRKLSGVLGLLTLEPAAYFRSLPGLKDVDVEAIESRIAERHEARRSRDFARADRIRSEIAAMGVELEDGPEGTSWRLA